MVVIKFRSRVVRDIAMTLGLEALLNAVLLMVPVDFLGLEFGLSQSLEYAKNILGEQAFCGDTREAVGLWSSRQSEGNFGEQELTRMLRLTLAALAGGVVEANVWWFFAYKFD